MMSTHDMIRRPRVRSQVLAEKPVAIQYNSAVRRVDTPSDVRRQPEEAVNGVPAVLPLVKVAFIRALLGWPY